MSVILLNMLSMMIQHYDQPKEVELAIDYLNYVFTGIFTIEAVIRLTAMRLEYFKYGMNVFDFVIVVFSIAGKFFFPIKTWDYECGLSFRFVFVFVFTVVSQWTIDTFSRRLLYVLTMSWRRFKTYPEVFETTFVRRFKNILTCFKDVFCTLLMRWLKNVLCLLVFTSPFYFHFVLF